MPIVECSVLVNAPQERVFALTESFAARRRWDPFIRDSRLLGGALKPAVGVQNWVRAYNGFSMVVEYVTYKPPQLAAMKMLRGPWFLASFGGSWQFKAQGDETEVTFRYMFRTRWPLLAPVLDGVIRFFFRRDIRARVLGLKRVAEAER